MQVLRVYSVPERIAGAGVAVAGAAAVWPMFTSHTGLGAPCLLRTFTGIPCPGCGLTTASVDLVHGRVGASLATSPVVLGVALLMAVMLPVMVLRKFDLLPPPKPWSPGRRKAVERVMLGVAAASWVFQLHRFGFIHL